MTDSDAALDQLLAAIEQRELNSLRWGYVDGSLSEDDLLRLATRLLNRDEDEAAELVESLVQHALAIELRQPDGSYRYRSRFAEAVRLLRTLKLLVPTRAWPAAPNLVSDYRVDARPRRAPRRDIPPDTAIEALGLAASTPLRSDLANALLHQDGHPVLLSAFQARAAQEILDDVNANRGIVVSAGTGSGKTLAFYLPTLVEIGAWVEAGVHWTKAVALYPRIELLKDQFSEAYRLARKLDSVLMRAGRRPVTIGSFFSLTPARATPAAVEAAHWPPAKRVGFVCPFLVCPLCGGELIWRQADLTQGIEHLVCASAPRCSGAVAGETVALTRERAVERPPDMLFTTAETINQRLSDTARRVVFGMHPNMERRLRLVLLDEIHTYTGTTGAQTALVLRRWRHALGQPLRMVGLSATLRAAPDFFAQLTGLPTQAVVEVTPAEDELDRVSMEYQLVLRGDPVSQTSLLSTSIQAAYLMGRILDPPVERTNERQSGKSGGRVGTRAFVFTDDLDVVNRFFDDLRDAEGYDIFGKPEVGRSPLAALRASARPDVAQRDEVGQLWRLCEQIGRPTTERLRISRTSSQDAGVSTSSDVVVATAALEVGFDDPDVGAVLQHKAPRELAAFVQRKGRAGRTMRMRPWMVTVLSDYGRDRSTYQAYEQLFDPILPPQQLPIHNQYILRMQAVFAFIDWLSDNNPEVNLRDWWWHALNGPASNETRQRQQRAVLKTVRAILRGEGDLRERLAAHLRHALQISDAEVVSLLWEPPRSLLLEVLPTLDRRISTQWAIGPGGRASVAQDLMATPPAVHPLPDFLPSNLFSDLSLPEVTVMVPPAYRGAEEHRELMPIVQALRQLAPGRVTRRFAYERGGLNHWVPVPLDADTYPLRIDAFAEQYEYVAEVTTVLDGTEHQLPCFRPWMVRIQPSPREVSTSSNSFLNWSSQILPAGEALAFSVTRARGWEAVIEGLDFYLHRYRAPVTVRRFAVGSTATLRFAGTGEERVVVTHFTTDQGEPAALGFEQEVDGLRVRFRLPDADELAAHADQSSELPSWRTIYFRDRVLHDAELSGHANVFQRDWLYQIYFSALVAEACRREVSLADAHATLHGGDPIAACYSVMTDIFQVLSESEGPEDAEPRTSDIRSTGRLQQRLTDLLHTPQVLMRLQALASELWAPDDFAWRAWLRQRVHATLGEMLLSACLYVAPQQAGMETLLLDLDRGPGGDDAPEQDVEVWITESTLGGAGVIEAIAEVLAEQPDVLVRALEAVLASRSQEVTSGNLDRFVELVLRDDQVAAATQRVRQQHDHDQRDEARATLYRLLAQRGLGVDHSFSVALNHRLLRPGWEASSDRLVADVLAFWHQTEARLGIALDLRVLCYLAAANSVLKPRLRAFVAASTGVELDTAGIVGVIAGILWPRSVEVRSHTFDGYSPFRERGFTDPALVRDLLPAQQVVEVHLDDPDWEERLHDTLAGQGSARLVAACRAEGQLRQQLSRVIATPVNVDYLQFFPTIEQIVRDEAATAVTLVLRELA